MSKDIIIQILHLILETIYIYICISIIVIIIKLSRSSWNLIKRTTFLSILLDYLLLFILMSNKINKIKTNLQSLSFHAVPSPYWKQRNKCSCKCFISVSSIQCQNTKLELSNSKLSTVPALPCLFLKISDSNVFSFDFRIFYFVFVIVVFFFLVFFCGLT